MAQRGVAAIKLTAENTEGLGRNLNKREQRERRAWALFLNHGWHRWAQLRRDGLWYRWGGICGGGFMFGKRDLTVVVDG